VFYTYRRCFTPEGLMRTLQPARLIAAAAALIGVAACSNKSPQMDESLKQDIAAVRAAPSAQMVVSALEAGEAATPAPVSHKRAPQPVNHPAKQVAQNRTPAPAPTPRTPAVQVTPSAPVEQPVVAAPSPSRQAAPARAEDTHHGPYKTEAEIFRQMPWIRP
jgi:hypothetical protein